MMRFLLLLILPFVLSLSASCAVRSKYLTDDHSIFPTIPAEEIRPATEPSDSASPAVVPDETMIEKPASAEIVEDKELQEDSLSKFFGNSFIVSPRDTFPIQIGAFKNKANAERILRGIQRFSNINVRIIDEEGLYKVRVSNLPENIRSREEKETAAPVSVPEPDNTTSLKAEENEVPDDTVRKDTAFIVPPKVLLMAKTDTIETPVDTLYTDGEILFFGINSPWLKRIRYFGESFAFVNALIITILLSIISMITLLVVILLNRRRMEKEQARKQFLMEKYQSLIIDYLYGTATAAQFKSIASDNYSRQVLIDQMIDVSVNLKGEESRKLISLYKHLGLDMDSLSRARDFRWHRRIKGFRELAFMNIKDANSIIYKALNSKNDILRMEAQIALVRLSDEDHFGFLSRMKRPFSLWEQITLHDLIIQHSIPVPEFRKWLGSSNNTVVVFCLRMIREFKQADAEEDVIKILDHPLEEVRLLAVQVAGDLGYRAALDPMKRMYKKQDYKVCLEIVRSMGKIPDTSMLGFLKLVLDKEDDVQLQIEATKSIEKMGEEGVKALVKIMKSEYKNYNIVIRHVLDRRIN